MPFPLPHSIRSDRLNVRPIDDADLATVFRLCNNADVRRYCRAVRWPDMAQASAWLARIRQRVADGNAMQFVIELHASKTVIGTCVLFQIDEANQRAEIGYALGREFWGMGYMHAALVALVAYAFRVLGLHRLEAEVDPRNENSAASLRRLGFQLEGLQKERWIVDDEILDSGLYGLLRSEWSAHKTMASAA